MLSHDDKHEADRDENRVTNGSRRPPTGVDGSRPRRWHTRRSACQHRWYSKLRTARFGDRFGQPADEVDRSFACPLEALAFAIVKARRFRGSART